MLDYSSVLASTIDASQEIAPGSSEEIEIRAATVWAVELIQQRIPEFTSAQIDMGLWLLSQDIRDQMKPYHRTRTIFY